MVDGQEGPKEERDMLTSQTGSSHLTPTHFDTWLGREALDKELYFSGGVQEDFVLYSLLWPCLWALSVRQK